MVRLPAMLYLPPAAGVIDVDTNVIVGWLATSRKSSVLRCSSRFSTRVLIDFTSMVALTLALVRSLPSYSTVPVTAPKSPRMFEIIRWRTVNWAREWAVSICQDWANAGAAVTRIAMRAYVSRVIG